MTDDDKPQFLPEQFRASVDTADEAAYARLLANDKSQRDLGERINSPFLRATPNDIARSKAQITIDTLSIVPRTPEQDERFAEAWACIGRYDVAAAVTQDADARQRYESILQAIERGDDKWCEHADHHKFVEARIYSQKHHREKSLVSCNICRFKNVTSTPDFIKNTAQAAMRHQGSTKGQTINQCKDYHEQSVPKNGK